MLPETREKINQASLIADFWPMKDTAGVLQRLGGSTRLKVAGFGRHGRAVSVRT